MGKSLTAALAAVAVPAALLVAAGTAQATPAPVGTAPVGAAAPADRAPSATAKALAAAGEVTIRNRYNDRCLQARGDVPGSDARLVNCDAQDPRQRWDIAWVYTQAGGYYELRGATSGLCLDADWGSIGTNGTRMQVWNCVGPAQTNQHWRMRPVTNLPNTYQITVETNNRCLDGHLQTIDQNPGRVQLWDCLGAGQINQHWRIA
ncbi:RICIN domain-containing protein [Streptomyces sp. NPDC057638]|uniref:RICIN domain-containing protein n=1 Tax=Streptomyces sp. NPDC057638 TaxID=3346190 RepID=UPI0036BFD6FD